MRTNTDSMKAIYLFLSLILLATSCAVKQPPVNVTDSEIINREIPRFTPREALEATNAGTLLLDVREAEERAVTRYDVDPQLDIPFSKLAQRMDKVPRDQTVIVACASGGRSTKAIQMLREAGFTNLVNLTGGMKAWQLEGLPVVEGPNKH